MNATEAKQLLTAHGLTLKAFLKSKTSCSYSEIQGKGLRYHRAAINKFIADYEKDFPPIEGEMFKDWG